MEARSELDDVAYFNQPKSSVEPHCTPLSQALYQVAHGFLSSLYLNDELLPLQDHEVASNSLSKTRPTRLDSMCTKTVKKYVGMTSIMGLLSKLEQEDRTISQRDIYYAFKSLFRKQEECNRTIISLGKVLGLKRYEMRIEPSNRGKVAGDLQFKPMNQNYITDCNVTSIHGGIPISHVWSSQSWNSSFLIASNALYLVIIEKEGVFLRFCQDNFTEKLRCILVTGCGFPDIATRALVHCVKNRLPHVKVVCITDCNPFGLSLLLTYKFGSKAKDFEGSGLKWLGLRPSQARALSVSRSSQDPLTTQDVKKINDMLNYSTEKLHESYRQELMLMKSMGTKIELEALYSKGITFAANFFWEALKNKDFL